MPWPGVFNARLKVIFDQKGRLLQTLNQTILVTNEDQMGGMKKPQALAAGKQYLSYLDNVKHLLITLLIVCLACRGGAQGQKQTSAHSFSPHEVGLTAGFSRYELSELFGPSDEYNAGMLALSYNYRAARHLQLGLAGEVGIAEEVADISAFSFNMSFPIGRGESYFYPGWHYTHAVGFNGVGLHLGYVKTINPWLAANIHCNGTMFFLGYRLSGAVGVRARF